MRFCIVQRHFPDVSPDIVYCMNKISGPHLLHGINYMLNQSSARLTSQSHDKATLFPVRVYPLSVVSSSISCSVLVLEIN